MRPGAYGALELAGFLFGLTFVAFLVLMRLRLRDESATRSQRWALSILVWLFTLNTILYGIQIQIILPGEQGWRLHDDINMLVPLLVLSMAFIYPRPRFSPGWTRVTLALLAAIAVVIEAYYFSLRLTGQPYSSALLQTTPALEIAYVFSWYLPVFMWLPDYDNESSKQSRMLLTLLIWGFLSYPLLTNIYFSASLVTTAPWYMYQSQWFLIIHITLITLIIIRLTQALWRRWGTRESPERLHAFFLLGFIVVSIPLGATTPFSIARGSDLKDWALFTFPWIVLRPAIFLGAFLRYQIVAPAVKGFSVDRTLALFGSVPGAFFVAALVLGLGAQNLPSGEIVAGVVAAISWYPLFRGLELIVKRLLPATRPSEELARQEVRTSYLITLQTAVHAGRIADPDDERAIEELRNKLGISKREHALLMNDLAARDASRRRVGSIKNVFLILSDGRLVCHIGSEGTEQTDQTLVAAMLTAIRQFVADGLGGKGELETVKFGEEVLAIEARGNLVMAASVVGVDLPDLRQRLGDWLALIQVKFGTVLKDWDGDLARIKGVDQELRRFMKTDKT